MHITGKTKQLREIFDDLDKDRPSRFLRRELARAVEAELARGSERSCTGNTPGGAAWADSVPVRSATT